MTRTVFLWAVAIMFLNPVHAQDTVGVRAARLHSGKIGLGLDGITGSSNVLLEYFFNNQFAIHVIAGLGLDLPGGSAPPGQTKVNGVTARGGLSLLVHLNQDQVSPYVGVEAVYQYAKAGGFFSTVPDPKNSLIISGVLGGDFFINERFALGLKQALGAEVSLKRDVPKEETDIMLNTSTVATARFYFN